MSCLSLCLFVAQCLAHIEYSKTLVEQWVSEWTAGFVWSMTKLWNFEAQGWSKGFFQVDLRNWSWSPSQSQWKQLWPRLPLLDLCPHQKSQCKARSGSLSLISQRMFASLSWKSQIKLLPDTFKSQFFFFRGPHFTRNNNSEKELPCYRMTGTVLHVLYI